MGWKAEYFLFCIRSHPDIWKWYAYYILTGKPKIPDDWMQPYGYGDVIRSISPMNWIDEEGTYKSWEAVNRHRMF